MALPIAVSGTQRPLTLAGNSTSEAHLSLSDDSRFVVLAGYAVTPGTTDPVNTLPGTANRVVGRIDAAGNVDTTTLFTTVFNGDNARSAASTNGSEFWIAGAGTGSTGGVCYNQLGANGGETRVLAAPNNVRVISVVGGQLFGSSSLTSFTNVFSIGLSTPTMAGQTATSLPGMPTTGASPFAYAMFDLAATPVGNDTMYVADASAAASAGGVQKWTFNGTTWSRVAVLNIAANVGFRSVAGYTTDVAGQKTVTLMATTAEATPRLVGFVDTGAATPVGTILVDPGGEHALPRHRRLPALPSAVANASSSAPIPIPAGGAPAAPQPHPDDGAGGPASTPPSGGGLHTSGAQILRPACSSHSSWQTAATHALTALTWS